MTKRRLVELYDQWKDCRRCELSKLRGKSQVLFGSGYPSPDYLLIKGAPNESEVEAGALLKGSAGQLVEDLLVEAGIDPIKEVFRTPIVGCRSYVVLPATEDTEEKIQDRSPSKEERTSCFERIERLIYILDPRLIIVMGADAWETVVVPKDRHPHKTITAATGRLFETKIKGVFRQVTYPVLVTESPEKMLANPSSSEHGPIATTLKYFSLAKAYVDMQKRMEHEEKSR